MAAGVHERDASDTPRAANRKGALVRPEPKDLDAVRSYVMSNRRRGTILFILACLLFTLGFTLTGRQASRLGTLTRRVAAQAQVTCERQNDVAEAIVALRPVVAKAGAGGDGLAARDTYRRLTERLVKQQDCTAFGPTKEKK